ncbi:efflux RND transporter permease subunit [bacterium]|nr:efflux RND transporter permease subunit [bacterium]
MKLIDTATRRRVTIAMFTMAVALFGLVSFFRLKINLLPDLSYPTLTIRTEYKGAAPVEIENLISKPIEEALGIVKGVKRVSSISRSGQSDVLLEFEWGVKMDYAGLDVREKLDALILPLDVPRPTILRFDPSLDPIMRYGFYRTGEEDNDFDEDALKELRRFAEEEIKKELEVALGVAAVKVSGGLEEEIQICVDQAKAAQLNLSISHVAAQLAAENVNLSGGRLKEGSRQYLVRTLNEFRTVEEIAGVVVAAPGGKSIHLRDIAEIRQGYKEREAVTRLDGRESVEIAIYKEGDANTVAVARAVERRISIVQGRLPQHTRLRKVIDQSTFITQAVDDVIQAGLIGGLLAVFILYFFLRDIWATIIISMSIPVSVIATFNLMYGADLTLNIMSLGGIALGIGMLLDNSIVVLENIAKHRERGKSGAEAARDGASEVGMAVIASTLTTVAVFFPLVFVKGIAGQLFRDQALTVTFALLASLVVAVTLIPMLASMQGRKKEKLPPRNLKTPRRKIGRWAQAVHTFWYYKLPSLFIRLIGVVFKGIGGILARVFRPLLVGFDAIYKRLEIAYPRWLGIAMGRSGIIVVAAMILFIVSLLVASTLGRELIPQLSQGSFDVEFKLPAGSPLDRTDGVLQAVQMQALEMDGLDLTFAVAGSGNRMDANPDQGGENWGTLNVLMRKGTGAGTEAKIMEDFRGMIRRWPGVIYKMSRPTLFTFKTPVEIEIAGYNLVQLTQISREITNLLSRSQRFVDVKSTMLSGHPEIQIRFDRERAASLGLAVHEIANVVVSKVRGDVPTRYSWRDRKIDIRVRNIEDDRNSVAKIRSLIINPQSPRPVTLDAVADVIEDIGPGEIRRINQERVALVSANLAFGDLGAAAEEVEALLDGLSLPTEVDVRLAGQNEEMSVSFNSLKSALILAVFLVYLVMASQFESFLHPLVILMTIPLALIGAVLALWITGAELSVVVFIGAILLAGIVVNNAIVLIDKVNGLRAGGMNKRDALIEGGRSRLRPILMTTLTTALGLLPMALGVGEGAEVRAPMAITVIGGLLVSTMLTLIVIPVVYNMVDRKS